MRQIQRVSKCETAAEFVCGFEVQRISKLTERVLKATWTNSTKVRETVAESQRWCQVFTLVVVTPHDDLQINNPYPVSLQSKRLEQDLIQEREQQATKVNTHTHALSLSLWSPQ